MRRIHLFEWEDQPWLPTVFRDFITDHLRYTQNEGMRRPVNVAIAQRLKSLLERVGTRRLVDLCAGAGGPLVNIRSILAGEMGFPVEILLTDLYPNVAAFRRLEAESEGLIRGRYESTSALDVPAELEGVRTLFTALHHFPPEQVRLLLADAVSKRAGVAVFEPLERTVRMVLLMSIMTFVRGLTHTPRVGRLTLPRFLLTYVCPVAPAIFAWDGTVSAHRTYSAEELMTLARNATTGRYEWEAGTFDVQGPYGRMPTTYLIGCPG
jgi:hypothetical protein